MATRLEIYPEVLLRLGLPNTDPRVATDKVYPAINQALRKMARDFPWPWLYTSETFTLSSGSTSHTPPDDWSSSAWVSVPLTGSEIRLVQRRAMIRYGNITRFPEFFSTQGGILTFAPTPQQDVVMEHQYIRKETVLENDTDETLCPDDYIDIVYVYAAIERARALKDSGILASLQQELADAKQQAKASSRNAMPNMGIRARHSWRTASWF